MDAAFQAILQRGLAGFDVPKQVANRMLLEADRARNERRQDSLIAQEYENRMKLAEKEFDFRVRALGEEYKLKETYLGKQTEQAIQQAKQLGDVNFEILKQRTEYERALAKGDKEETRIHDRRVRATENIAKQMQSVAGQGVALDRLLDFDDDGIIRPHAIERIANGNKEAARALVGSLAQIESEAASNLKEVKKTFEAEFLRTPAAAEWKKKAKNNGVSDSRMTIDDVLRAGGKEASEAWEDYQSRSAESLDEVRKSIFQGAKYKQEAIHKVVGGMSDAFKLEFAKELGASLSSTKDGQSETGTKPRTPEEFAKAREEVLKEGGASPVGGAAGATDTSTAAQEVSSPTVVRTDARGNPVLFQNYSGQNMPGYVPPANESYGGRTYNPPPPQPDGPITQRTDSRGRPIKVAAPGPGMPIGSPMEGAASTAQPDEGYFKNLAISTAPKYWPGITPPQAMSLYDFYKGNTPDANQFADGIVRFATGRLSQQEMSGLNEIVRNIGYVNPQQQATENAQKTVTGYDMQGAVRRPAALGIPNSPDRNFY